MTNEFPPVEEGDLEVGVADGAGLVSAEETIEVGSPIGVTASTVGGGTGVDVEVAVGVAVEVEVTVAVEVVLIAGEVGAEVAVGGIGVGVGGTGVAVGCAGSAPSSEFESSLLSELPPESSSGSG
jgi:hypothetical protein